ncbi:MAG: CBS domain-containing protein [Mariprofundaceae bacterium]|nr:CBS domain-containing protein [Mariprofundaceae bacterium]
MYARDIMKTAVVSARSNERLSDLMQRIYKHHVRMLPVIDDHGKVCGAVSTFSIMEHMLPSYVTSGDLGNLSFAPDMDLLRTRYKACHASYVNVLMDEALLVEADESVLAVAAALIDCGKHECAIVVDKDQRLLGLISAEDVLNSLTKKLEIL